MRINRYEVFAAPGILGLSLVGGEGDLVAVLRGEEIAGFCCYESGVRISNGNIMSALLARTGRHRQRYRDGFRLVAGCIPYRLKRNLEDLTGDLEDGMEVLMISSPNRHDLVFPKGGWEDDETVYAAACREALEEAGVRGNLDEKPLGEWKFRSKSRQASCSLEGCCWGYMFALEVVEELESWPEQANHDRKWLTVTEASLLCRYDWMRVALEQCRQRVLEDNKHGTGDNAPTMTIPAPVSSYFVKSPGTQCIENPINALC